MSQDPPTKPLGLLLDPDSLNEERLMHRANCVMRGRREQHYSWSYSPLARLLNDFPTLALGISKKEKQLKNDGWDVVVLDMESTNDG